jgi:hypothetical protein
MRFSAFLIFSLFFATAQFFAFCQTAQAQRVSFVSYDPQGACNGYGTTLVTVNTTTGTVMSCLNSSWVKTGGGYGVPSVSSLPTTCDPTGSPNIVFLGAAPYGVYGCSAVNQWTQVGPTIIRADAYGSLIEAVAAGGFNAEVVLPAGYVAALNSPLPIGGVNVTLRCQPGSMIIKDFTGNGIVVSGTNVVIDGCTMDGARLSYGGTTLIVSDANGVLVKNSTIENGIATAIEISAVSNVTFLWNTITGNLGSAIYAQDSLNGLEISGNYFDSSAAAIAPSGVDTIGIHTLSPGAAASGISIHDNTIVHGGSNFAVEIGSFGSGSQPPTGVAVFNNTIRLVAPSNGAISLSTCNTGQVSYNNIDAGGHPMVIDALEFAFANNITAVGNTIHNTASGTTYTVALNGGSNNTIANNVLEGAIYLGTSSASDLQVNANTVQSNTVTASTGAVLSRGMVWLQCNVPNCSVSQNVINGNTLSGNASGPGINFENDYGFQGGVMDANTASANQITGASVLINIGSNVTRTSQLDEREQGHGKNLR